MTVLSLFKELKVDGNLYARIFGESVLNDAVAIVLYTTATNFLNVEISLRGILHGAGVFFIVSLGSLFIGAAVSLCSALVLSSLSPFPSLSFLSLFLFHFFLPFPSFLPSSLLFSSSSLSLFSRFPLLPSLLHLHELPLLPSSFPKVLG